MRIKLETEDGVIEIEALRDASRLGCFLARAHLDYLEGVLAQLGDAAFEYDWTIGASAARIAALYLEQTRCWPCTLHATAGVGQALPNEADAI